MVTKHWRQDWQYEPRQIIEYQGWNRWQRRTLARKQTANEWSQTVYQVDESPRYASLGRWEHSASFSSWISGETWRPLPRREWSVRQDYQVLLGTNRHTIDRKSTRLNSSHGYISYAVFCLKKKKKIECKCRRYYYKYSSVCRALTH